MNGNNQPLTFTRADAERLTRIESKIDEVLGLKTQVTRNTTIIRIFKWIIAGGSGLSGGLLALLKYFN